MEFLSVSEAARKIGCRPREISDAFYARKLDDKICPVVGRRRLIPRSYLKAIRETVAAGGIKHASPLSTPSDSA